MYSQHNEDEYLFEYIRKNRIKCPKIIMEMGACDGKYNSNSRMFIEKGWKGHLIEPYDTYYNELKKLYEGKISRAYFCAIGTETGKFPFKVLRNMIGHSHLTHPDSDTYDYLIATYTLADFFKIAEIKEIGILSIDVEGLDTVIAVQLMKTKVRPTFIIIESNSKRARERQTLVLEKEYKLIATKNVNTIWLKN